MRNAIPIRTRKSPPEAPDSLAKLIAGKVIGQQSAIEAIVPYVSMYQAGLAPEGRPAGVFLLLGPTGTGKTRTVEALASALHGSERSLLRIDCGEFQMDHEVAKLIGAPPGYLGHRETQPMLTQQKLNSVVTDRCGLSIVLFDEIEKAAPSLNRLLLGVLDQGILRLGDNTTVNFQNSLIFLTSNLGAHGMQRELRQGVGFGRFVPRSAAERQNQRLESIALAAVKRRFSPEFLNRIDLTLTYHPLSEEALSAILDLQLQDLQRHIANRLGPRAFELEVTPESRAVLLNLGTSKEYGARHLKRAIHRHLMQPLASMITAGEIAPGATVIVEAAQDNSGVILRVADAGRKPGPLPAPANAA